MASKKDKQSLKWLMSEEGTKAAREEIIKIEERIERERRMGIIQKPLKKAGSGLSPEEKRAWVKANTPENKKKALDRSRTRGPLYK